MVDNPFANGGTPPVEETKIEPPLVVDEEGFEAVTEEIKPKETNLEKVQRILAEYNNYESDIPLTHPEYWHAKRNL